MKILVSCLVMMLSALSALGSSNAIVVSIPDQKLLLLDHGTPVAQFPISTSRFGVGDAPGSYSTPLGVLKVAKKIGHNAPIGAVFKGRRFTGEVLRPNSLGRDPIVTRIIWLRGLEHRNCNAFRRGIYIHGTPQERTVGRPASYGCIRMRSRDVVKLFRRVDVGANVAIVNASVKALTRGFAHGSAKVRADG
jgi:L,D-transpeptidase catalytic domain